MSYSNYHSRRIPGFIRYIVDLIRFQHLCWNLVGSDLRSRFRRSRVGILWAVIQPLAFSLLIAWAWGTLFNAQDYWTFALYVFAGMLVWEYFGNTLNGALDALTGAVGYLRQSRVPLLVFQARVPITGMVTYLAGLCGLLGMLLALGKFPPIGWHLLLILAFPFVMIAFLLPLAIMFSVWGAQLRDLRHIIQIGLQALFFISPVMLDRAMLSGDRLAILQFLNPLVPLLDMMRAPLLYGREWTNLEMITLGVWGALLWVACFVVAGQAGRRIVFAL
jgi:lipopolysaccharide transport system permease protein